MEKKLIQEIIECLPKDRTKFYYFKDKYVLMLLSYLVKNGTTVRDIEKSQYKRLLQKPLIQRILQKTGSKELSSNELGSYWPDEYQCYLLTLDLWGDDDRWSRFYNQTSRPGWNLVLQLNFSSEHNSFYKKLIKPREFHPFHAYGHPIVNEEGSHTLAWARIDIDLQRDEALIEEIQNDWIRRALKSVKVVSSYDNGEIPRNRHLPGYVEDLGCNAASLFQYVENILKPHVKLWEEAMLSSAIWFLKEEIGISSIFYHTFDLGCRLKRIDGRKPPKSLYTKLPQRFCFSKTSRTPSFLLSKNNRTIINLLRQDTSQFYLLDM